jgi:hypothetical protein
VQVIEVSQAAGDRPIGVKGLKTLFKTGFGGTGYETFL